MLIGRDTSCLLVVDLQEKLLPAMQDPMLVVRNAGILMQAAARLGVPILVSEQYPQGLGPTVAELRHLAPPESIHAKTAFSCADDPDLRLKLADFQRAQVIVCGIEAHVCVLQTAIDLEAQGFEAFVVADAVGSRSKVNRKLAINRLLKSGVDVVDSEMVLFEWLGRAGTPEFKELQALVK